MAFADRKPRRRTAPESARPQQGAGGRNRAAHGDHFAGARRVIERAEELPIYIRTSGAGPCMEDRLMLTDKPGQHKDNRSRNRPAAADIKALEVETVEIPVTRQGDDVEAYKVTDYSIFKT